METVTGYVVIYPLAHKHLVEYFDYVVDSEGHVDLSHKNALRFADQNDAEALCKVLRHKFANRGDSHTCYRSPIVAELVTRVEEFTTAKPLPWTGEP